VGIVVTAAAERLTALDATFLELEEADESAHMHIGGVMVLAPAPGGGAPPLERVRTDTLARLGGLPRYRQRLSEPRTGGLRWPTWDPDPDFDIANHVRAEGLPAPGGIDELREWAGEYFSIRLDRRRPLWELVVIELGDGRWAMVSKTHHCLVDGVGSVDAAKVLLDTAPDASSPAEEGAPSRRIDEPEPEAGQGPGAGLSLDPRALAGASMRFTDRLLRGAGGTLVRAAVGLERAARPHRLAQALRDSRAIAEVLLRDELVAAPKTSLNEPIGAHRRLAVIEVPLETLKEIRRGLGGTVNDAVLAATTGGLRALLVDRGESLPSDGLRAMVPVNIRPAADRLALGNQITSLFVHLPVDVEDPVARYRAQLEEAEGLKSSDQATGTRGIVDLAAMAPPVLHSFLARSLFATRLFNVTITNVPGPQLPLYALGSEVEQIWPLVPLAAEHAIGVAVLSYNGSVFFCINADHDSVRDLDRLREAIVAEIEQLASIAGERDGSGADRGDVGSTAGS
jgi:diacylglycerol O-acyltransferase / wax synthase